MTPERWKKVNEIFQSAIELEPNKQKPFLDKACGADNSLRQQVETLLAANDEAGAFIDGNAANDVAHLLTLQNSETFSGEYLGHYEIISILGSGGMGKVYLAKDSKLNRSIAVKTLPNFYVGKPSYVKRFQTEAKAAANLNHPNVATIYSVEETDDEQTFITMEYVEGNPLNKMIPKDGFDQRTFLDIFISLADALTHAHEKGIVHRDIKPSNIMITPAGNPKILDFGLARIDKTKTNENASTLSLTETGQILGTPAYMSPEQAEGKEADHRTDIFSLGVVMYEAITGERPFKGDNYAAIISKLLKEEPKNISEIKPNIPYLLSRLIMKCLNKKPRYRYQSMNEVRVLLKEINSAIDSGASLSRPEQITSKISPKRISPLFLYAGFGLLSLFGLLAFWSWSSLKTTTSKEIIKFNMVGDKENKLSVITTKLSPDGKTLIFSYLQSKNDRVRMRKMDSYEIKTVSGTKEARFPFFSPDGEWIAYATDSDKILKVPIKGGDPITVCEICSTIRVGHWATDENIYFSSEQGIKRVSADGGKPEDLTKIDKSKGEISHTQPILLPDQKNVIFTIMDGDGLKLSLLNLQQNKRETIKEAGEGWHAKYSPTGHIVFARDKQLMAMPFDLSTAKPTGKPKLIISGLFAQAPNIQITNDGTLTYIPNIIRTENQLVWVNRNNEETPAFKEKGDFVSPRISPDGNHIAVRLNDDIWNYNIKSESKIRISSNGRSEIPMWSLDGKSIFYVSPNNEGSFSIYKKNADGTGEPEEIHKEDYRLIPYSIHPTENLLSLVSRKGTSDIFVKSLEDQSIKPVVATPFSEDTPRFSPDGQWLVYSSMDTGRPQIYVHPWDNLSKKIPITKESGMFPVWSKMEKNCSIA